MSCGCGAQVTCLAACFVDNKEYFGNTGNNVVTLFECYITVIRILDFAHKKHILHMKYRTVM